MSAPETKTFHSSVEIKDADKGIAEIVFATLNVKDHDGDVTLPGAFAGNDAVVVSAYGHKSWDGELPVGTARIYETEKDVRATVEYFMDTPHGAATFHTVKGLAKKGLGEYSYGFNIVEHEAPSAEMQKDGVRRVLKGLKVYEVSPVLRGAGIGTRTLAVKEQKPEEKETKAAPCPKCGGEIQVLREGNHCSDCDYIAAVEITEEEKQARYEITAKGRRELARFIQTMTRLAS